MANLLISFLGKSKAHDGYQKTRFRFEDGSILENRYIGLTLVEQLETLDSLVLLGTSGSMWDIFFTEMDEMGAYEQPLSGLIEAASMEAVQAEHLAQVTPLLEQQLGMVCHPVLIPHGEDRQQQMEILRLLSTWVAQGDTVYMDLTHGFRHLPMLGLMSALYLQSIKNVKIAGLFYGAYDMTKEGITPVLRLDGLLEIADWIRAMSSYDKDGDYGVFAALLPPTPETEALREAAFHERSINPEPARQKLTTFYNWFRQPSNRLPPAAELFRGALEERVSWFRSGKREDWEKNLAKIYLERKDYLRAAIFGFESIITRTTKALGLQMDIFEDRKRAKEMHKEESGSKAFTQLDHLRNNLAHGFRPRGQAVQNSTQTEQNLKETLTKLFKQLLP